MRYQHRFTVPLKQRSVAKFHSYSSSMADITPPPVLVQVHEAPSRLEQGDEMRFTLWLGPLPVEWHARIEQADNEGFIDRQVSGPFKRWIHRHHFEAVDKEMTLVHDTIDVELSDKPFARLLGWLMFRNLPVLFAYRQWRTRRILSEWR